MKKYLLMLLLLISTNATAQMCSLDWMHDNQREDNTPILDEDMLFEVKINEQIIEFIGTRRSWGYFIFGECPDCQSVAVRAVDANDITLKSDWVYPVCPPQQPTLCI